MSSSSSKRRKVTVDIKQTKLERGSVFARLGNKDKQKKKVKGDVDLPDKAKKESHKHDVEVEDKKSKNARNDEAISSKKSSKDRLAVKSKGSDYESKEHRKSHRYAEEREIEENQDRSRSHSKHKSDRSERKLEKIENLIIEKRISPEASQQLSRSSSPSSLSPKKKSKKHSSKHASSHDEQQRYLSLSPEQTAEFRKHKERGRSREKKKSSKETSKKSKDNYSTKDYDSQDDISSRHSSSKTKKAAKNKPEKEYSDELVHDKKRSKSKAIRHPSTEKEKFHGEISPVIYDTVSDDQYSRKHEKTSERSNKGKRKKTEHDSQSPSPVRHKKSKRQPSLEEEKQSEYPPARPHSSKKRSHKDIEVTKKKAVKEDSIQGTYSDYSSTSKNSVIEYSEISQLSGGNDDHYSSDGYAEKESKKRSKSKKKTRKDVDSSSKPRYEVIDDDYSDEGKKEKKKRKRKRDELDYLESPEKSDRYDDHEREVSRKKSDYIQPPEKSRHSEKYPPHDRHESFERRSSPHNRHEARMDNLPGESKRDSRLAEEKHYEPRKTSDSRDGRDRRKDAYDERKSTNEVRYTQEGKDMGYSHSKMPSRHISSERSSDRKVMDWHRDNMKHISGSRKESIPRLMASPHDQDGRSDSSRSSLHKYPSQRKMTDQDFHEQYHDDHSRPGHGSLDRGSRRQNERRLPPLLPPGFTRNHTPTRNTHMRDNHVYTEPDRFMETGRKYEKPHHRDSMVHGDNRDRKYVVMHDDMGSKPTRSGSHDSRSSIHHGSLDMKNKGRNHSDISSIRSLQSPRSDRNSSLERRDPRKTSSDRQKFTKTEHYDRRLLKSGERTHTNLVKVGDDRNEREQVAETSRPLKRHHDDMGVARRSGSSQDRAKKKRTSPNRMVSPSKRKPKQSLDSRKESVNSKERATRKPVSKKKTTMSKSSSNKVENEIDQTPEVDWNELPAAVPTEQNVPKEERSVLSKFSPGSLLHRTGIIMSMLPQNLLDEIDEIKAESSEDSSGAAQKSEMLKRILQNGLNSYSDERSRKYMLGFNIQDRHGFYPPQVINGRTYAASMKEYLRKTRLIEPV